MMRLVVMAFGAVIVLLQLSLTVSITREAICDHGQTYSDRAQRPQWILQSVLPCQDEKEDAVYDAQYEQPRGGGVTPDPVAVAQLRASYRANQIAAAQLWISALEAIAVAIALSVAAVGLLIQAIELRKRRG